MLFPYIYIEHYSLIQTELLRSWFRFRSWFRTSASIPKSISYFLERSL